MPLLSAEEVDALVKIAQNASLDEPQRRSILFGGIPHVMRRLPTKDRPADQLLSDIHEMNTIAALPGVAHPLSAWLQNAVRSVPSTRKGIDALHLAAFNIRVPHEPCVSSVVEGEADAGDDEGEDAEEGEDEPEWERVVNRVFTVHRKTHWEHTGYLNEGEQLEVTASAGEDFNIFFLDSDEYDEADETGFEDMVPREERCSYFDEKVTALKDGIHHLCIEARFADLTVDVAIWQVK